MAIQHRLMYGLNLSPIRAHFQKTPRNLYGEEFMISTSRDGWAAVRIGLLALAKWHVEGRSPVFIPVQRAGNYGMYIGACADEQQHA